jgi:hypothetical protein
MMTIQTVRLHKPHAKQRDFQQSTAKRKVIVAGRRGGKTTGVADLAVMRMLTGDRVLEAAPIADQTSAFWDACRRALAEPIAGGYVRKNETDRLLEAPNGGRIRCKTAHDADSLRGDYADLLILDEYSIMEPDAWEEVGAPMLLDNDGDAVFIFTPKRRNHAFTMYQRAQADDTGRWATWHFTSHDNPYLSPEALADITRDMTEAAYRQEILAEFLEEEGLVFRRILDAATIKEPIARVPSHTYVMGVDWGKSNDYTVLTIGDATTRQAVYMDRFNQIDYAVQRGRLMSVAQRYGVSGIVAEANSIGEPIIEQLQRDGLPVQPFQTTNATKAVIIEALALAFERGDISILNDPVLVSELQAYEMDRTPSGMVRYGAPEGMHDDTVMALALMWYAIGDSRPLLLWGDE